MPLNEPRAFILAARGLLRPSRGRPPEPILALAVLSRIEKTMEQSSSTWLASAEDFTEGRFPEPIPESLRRDYNLLRGRALLLLGRKDEARAALDLARRSGKLIHDVLILERDLDSAGHE